MLLHILTITLLLQPTVSVTIVNLTAQAVTNHQDDLESSPYNDTKVVIVEAVSYNEAMLEANKEDPYNPSDIVIIEALTLEDEALEYGITSTLPQSVDYPSKPEKQNELGTTAQSYPLLGGPTTQTDTRENKLQRKVFLARN